MQRWPKWRRTTASSPHHGGTWATWKAGAGVLNHEVVGLRTPYYERVEESCTPGDEAAAIDRLARQAVALRKPGARVIARLSGVAIESEAALREAGERALAQAWGSASGAGLAPRAGEGDDASTHKLELAAVSYAQLADVAVVREFMERVRSRIGNSSAIAGAGASASAAGGAPSAEASTLQAALRLGLSAFLESLS